MTETEATKFDAVLTSITQSAGNVDGLFDAVFGFLERRTDFYSNPQAGRELLLATFDRYAKAALERKREEVQKQAVETEKQAKSQGSKQEAFLARQAELASRPKVEEVADEPEADDEHDTENPPAGNGGKTDKYSWTQSLSALDVLIPVPPGTRAKDLNVKVTVTSLQVGLKGQSMLIDGSFHKKIRPDETMWTLVDGRVVQLNIEKLDAMTWWTCVIQGDQEIDTKKIVPEDSKLSDLDAETRSVVEKMMVDQQRKAAGLPSTEDQKKMEMLESFKKQNPQLDFSNAKIDWGGAGTMDGSDMNMM